jgi:hypothetical protein
MQSAALFPFTLLTLFSNGQIYEEMLLQIIAGGSTYLLLRRLSLTRWASAAGGVAFALNGTFALLSNAPINPIAFLPLTLLGIEYAYDASVGRRAGGWWLIGIAGALSFYAGFPETAYIDSVMALVWLGWRFGCAGREHAAALARKAMAGVAVGLLLSAPLLIPVAEYFAHADLGPHGGAYFGSFHLGVNAMPQLLLPYVYGLIFEFADPGGALPHIWENVGGYLSTSLLLLAILGLMSKGRSGLRLVLGGWVVLAIARIYGQPPILGHIWSVLPGMSRVAFLRYGTPSLELATIVLAALAVDKLTRAPAQRRRLFAAGLGSLAVLLLGAIAARSLAQRSGASASHHPYYEAAIVWGVGLVVAVVGAALVSDQRLRARLLALLVTLDLLVLFAVPTLSAPRSVKIDLAPVEYLQRHLGNSRFFTLAPLAPNYGSYFGVGSLNVVDIPIASEFSNYVHTRLDRVVQPIHFTGEVTPDRPSRSSPEDELIANLAGYRASAVSYVLTPAGHALPESGTAFNLVLRTPTTWIYRLRGAAPYFSAADTRCTVKARGRESAQVSCPAASTLIRRESDLAGWSAELDGHPVAVHNFDKLFQAVTVGAGSHRVSFSYAPPNGGIGFAAFAFGCGWLVVAFAARRRRLIAAASD